VAEQISEETLLGDLRVLDLTDEKGVYCTKILADLGADVIKIERPGGDPMRDNGPFYHDIPHRERSLYFWQFNANKKGITLNLESADGRAIFKRLVKTADILVETYRPEYLDGLGLSYEELSKINPALIVTSITGFGSSGPYKDYKGSDIVGVAMGGMMNVCGHRDTPPVMPFGEQAHHTASSYAAIASLIALYHRDATGKGQHIDVPMQSCVAFSLEFTNLWYIYWGEVLGRRGTVHGSSGPAAYAPNVYPCKDGHMCTFPGIVPMDWIEADGMIGDLNEPKWQDPFTKLSPEGQAHTMDITAAHTARIPGSSISPTMIEISELRVMVIAAHIRNMPIMADAIYSTLPCPQWWSSSGGTAETFKLTSIISDTMISLSECTASAINAWLLPNTPPKSFTARRRILPNRFKPPTCLAHQ